MNGATVMLLEDAEQISDGCLSYIISSLPPRRREKAENYFFRRDRANCAAAYALMRYMFMRFLGLNINTDWQIGRNGKPQLSPSYPHLHFNISHCSRAVACALHSSEIGVDVQDCISDISGISSLVLCERELKLLSACGVPEDIFFSTLEHKRKLRKMPRRRNFRQPKKIGFFRLAFPRRKIQPAILYSASQRDISLGLLPAPSPNQSNQIIAAELSQAYKRRKTIN